MTHSELCVRACQWLRGNRHCRPVLCGLASCIEVPDAIGWSSRWSHHGCIVVECKSSVADFRADAKKYQRWTRADIPAEWKISRRPEAQMLAAGFTLSEAPRMGDFRFYFCEAGILTADMVAEKAPDHGLLWRRGRGVHLVREAPRRTTPNRAAEVTYLRYALLHVETNLLTRGCSVDMAALAKFNGALAIDFPLEAARV